MPWIRAIFLVFVMTATSGYVFRCTWFCTDQTAIQEDYIEQRDRCRQDVQLQMDTSSTPLDENARKAALISEFSRCMAENGWAVPDGKPKTAAGTVQASAETQQSAEDAAAKAAEQKAALARASECAFARESADVSSIAATRAKACDLECAQYLKAAPEAPRPAACPPISNESLAKGTERE